MESKAGMEERHRMLTKPPSNEEFKTKQVIDVLIEFIIKYIPKMYGIHKIRSILAANPGQNLIHVMTVSDLAYAVSVIEDKKRMWEEQVELANMSPEERRNVQEDPKYKQAQPRFTGRKGIKASYLGHAWSKEGIKHYNDRLQLWKEKFRDPVFWDHLQLSCEMYDDPSKVLKMWRKTVSCQFIVIDLCGFQKEIPGSDIVVVNSGKRRKR